MDITQEEINRLIEVIKIEENDEEIIFTCENKKQYILNSEENKNEKFRLVFTVNRNPKKKTICILHNNFMLRRIDINGRHKNPDTPTGIPMIDKYQGQWIEETHIHISLDILEKEDAWAVPLHEVFTETSIEKILDFFSKITNIKEGIKYKPEIQNLKLF